MDDSRRIMYFEMQHARNPRARFFLPLADLYMKADRLDEALALLETGVGCHPASIPARLLLGICYNRMGRNQEAREVFSHVLATDPENTRVPRDEAAPADASPVPDLGPSSSRPNPLSVVEEDDAREIEADFKAALEERYVPDSETPPRAAPDVPRDEAPAPAIGDPDLESAPPETPVDEIPGDPAEPGPEAPADASADAPGRIPAEDPPEDPPGTPDPTPADGAGIVRDATQGPPDDESGLPPLFVTSTLADIYLAQNHREKALKILYQVLADHPDRGDIAARISEIEGAAEQARDASTPSRPEAAAPDADPEKSDRDKARFKAWLDREMRGGPE